MAEKDTSPLNERIRRIIANATPESAIREMVDWYEAKKEKGMISSSVTCVEGLHDPELLDDDELASAIEGRAAEFMRMVNAPTLPDPEVLGVYSPRL